jgi:ketosteroid isomerase-like protein
MTTRDVVEAWIEGYRRAWLTNDPTDIAALFTPDAIYRPSPFSDGWRGHEEIIDGWLRRRDEPGSWSFRHRVIAVDGEVAAIEGWIDYPGTGRGYSNLWILRVADDGRVREYTEWWVDPAARDPGERDAQPMSS